MYTTITVNGPHGAHFLSALGDQLASHAPALAPLLDGRVTSLEVDTALAEHVADVLEPYLTTRDTADPPLLFSPNVGDTIVIVRDVLLEYQPPARRGPRIWRFTPRGTKGRVIAHEPGADRVQLEASRDIAYVRPQAMTGVRFWAPR